MRLKLLQENHSIRVSSRRPYILNVQLTLEHSFDLDGI